MKYSICYLLFAICYSGCSKPPQPQPAKAVPTAAAARPSRYEFHLTANGLILWRCDRKTGQAAFCTLQDKVWCPITSPETFTFEVATNAETFLNQTNK